MFQGPLSSNANDGVECKKTSAGHDDVVDLAYKVKPRELDELLLAVAPVRPVFILGQPGIGKSAMVKKFADEVGMECISLLGTQLAPEDLVGVPQIYEDKGRARSRFAPPSLIVRDEPYVLFLDELNGSSSDVQKAFYSLILEKRIGEYHLPEGSVVIGAGNRSQDNAIVRSMSSALVNRMVFLELKASSQDWLQWAQENDVHPWVREYITQRPDHLCVDAPSIEAPFSTPRSWHMLSDILNSSGDLSDESIKTLAAGCISIEHVSSFVAFARTSKKEWNLEKLIKGDIGWPREPENGDLLLFLANSLRARLAKELPRVKTGLNTKTQELNYRSKELISLLAEINPEVAQVLLREDEKVDLPAWYLAEIIRDIPKISNARR